MEPFTSDQLTGIDLEVDDTAARHLNTAARWAKFISVTVFVLCGLVLFGLLVSFSEIRRIFRRLSFTIERISGSETIFLFCILLAGGFVVYLYYLLFSFSGKTQSAIRYEDKQLLNRGLSSLKLYFIITTVLSLLMLLFTLYGLLFKNRI